MDQSGNENNRYPQCVVQPVCAIGRDTLHSHFNGCKYEAKASRDGYYNIITGCGIVVNQKLFPQVLSNGWEKPAQCIGETLIKLDHIIIDKEINKSVTNYIL